MVPRTVIFRTRSKMASGALYILRFFTLNIDTEISLFENEQRLSHDFKSLVQRIIVRGMTSLLTTLLLTVTFGVAVPAVGVACALSAFVQLAHHRHILSRALSSYAITPDLRVYCAIPWSCGLTIASTAIIVWFAGCVNNLQLWAVGSSAAAVFAATVLLQISARFVIKSQTEQTTDATVLPRRTASLSSAGMSMTQHLLDHDNLETLHIASDTDDDILKRNSPFSELGNDDLQITLATNDDLNENENLFSEDP